MSEKTRRTTPVKTIRPPSRCPICGTSFNLYPLNYQACPVCERLVCRQCWGDNWKKLPPEPQACLHEQSVSFSMETSIWRKAKAPRRDWMQWVVILGWLLILAGLLGFLVDMFSY